MRIAYFSGHQDDVFIPALLWVLLATVIVVAIVVFFPALKRRPPAARAVIGGVGAVVAAAAIVLAATQVAAGFALMNPQRANLQAQISERYGLTVSDDVATHLLNGDSLTIPNSGTKSKLLLKYEKSLPGQSVPGYILTTKGLAGELPKR